MSIGMIYHSGHALLLAQAAYGRSISSKSESEVCILLCAAALEGFFNETAHAFSDAEEFVDASQA